MEARRGGLIGRRVISSIEILVREPFSIEEEVISLKYFMVPSTPQVPLLFPSSKKPDRAWEFFFPPRRGLMLRVSLGGKSTHRRCGFSPLDKIGFRVLPLLFPSRKDSVFQPLSFFFPKEADYRRPSFFLLSERNGL